MDNELDQSERSPVTGAILAGGRGMRMGGLDKGLVDYGGRPLIEPVLEAISPQVDHLLIVANRNPSRYAAYGFPVHGDAVPGFLGPLAGMFTAGTHADTDLILTVPCDIPHLPADLVARLHRTLKSHKAEICAASDGERLHPVVCLWYRSLAPTLAAALRDRRLKVQAWLRAQSFCIADFSDSRQCFDNLNRQLDLDASIGTS